MSLKSNPSDTIHLCPSRQDPPPPGDCFPPFHLPPLVESFRPTEADLANDPDMSLDLPESWSMERRWNSLCNPPDRVATLIMTRGLELEFLSEPPKSPWHDPPKGSITDANQIPVLSPIVKNWEERGILTRSHIPPVVFFSRMFHVKKKNGKFRPILDLSALNRYIATPSFKMETLVKILGTISQVMWATSLDVTDAFLSIPIHSSFQMYFCFILDGVVYMFLRMPFGLTTAPWAFSRAMRPIKVFLREREVSISSFLDDFFVLAVTSAQAALHTTWTIKLMQWLGLKINFEKSQLTPLQEIEHLGVLLDLRRLTLALPLDKVERLLLVCQISVNNLFISRRELESLVGLLNFAHPLIALGRLHLTRVITWMNSHTSPVTRDLPVAVDAPFREALRPFLSRQLLETPVSFRPLVPSLDVFTDASGVAWCGIVGPYLIRDYWTVADLSNSINWREMKAIYNTLVFCRECLTGQTLRIHTDNMVSFFCLKRMGSIHSPELNSLIRRFLFFCQDYRISIVPVHIKGALNVLADAGSRDGPISTEWCLDPDSFAWIFQQYRLSPQVDLFATRENFRFENYVSPCPDSGALFQDAFALDWNLHFRCVYLFPPPAAMDLLINKICYFRGTGILIAPFVSAPWLPKLLHRKRHFLKLPPDYFLFQVQNQQMFYQRRNYWNLHVWLL